MVSFFRIQEYRHIWLKITKNIYKIGCFPQNFHKIKTFTFR